MALGHDRSAFLAANETRLRIAEWCALESLSREEMARRLGRRSGGLSTPDTMVRRSALQHAGFAAGLGPGRRAELLKLNPSWRPALEAAQQRFQPGRLHPGGDLLLVTLADAEAACAVLAAGSPDIEWGMELGSEQLGLLLATRSDGGGRSTIRAAAALERGGARSVRIRLNAPMASAELRTWARSVASRTQNDALPRPR